MYANQGSMEYRQQQCLVEGTSAANASGLRNANLKVWHLLNPQVFSQN